VSDSSRSRVVLAHAFAGWFTAQHPSWSDIRVTVNRPQPGLSSDTVLLRVAHEGGDDEFVARLPPTSDGLFPDYDLVRQQRIQRAVAHAGFPVADALAVELDESWVGAPFLLMPKVPGHTLTTAPSYLSEGWLAGATPALQEQTIRRFIELLGTLHRTQFDPDELGELSGGGPDLNGILDYWTRYLDWATDDDEGAAIYRRALEWCRARVPADPPPPSLLWGDPQLVNLVLGNNGEIRAVLDWEMAGYGPGELDLAWFLSLHEHAAETAGTTLPGDPGRAALIAAYGDALGRPVADLEWYEVLANIRSGLIVLRIGALMERAGHSRSWTAKVPQPRYLATMIGA